MYHLAAEYRRSHWYFQISVDAKDEFFFSDRHAVRSDKYALVNTNAGYETESWKISIWGRNLNDKDYFTRAFGSFGNDPRKNYIVEPYGNCRWSNSVFVSFQSLNNLSCLVSGTKEATPMYQHAMYPQS